MTTLKQIKEVTECLDTFYDDEYGLLNKGGVSGQLSWDAIRIEHPNTGHFVGWSVGVYLENVGIDHVTIYDDQKEVKKATKDWKTAVARAVKQAITEYDIALELS